VVANGKTAAPPGSDRAAHLAEETLTWTELSGQLYFECDALCGQIRELRQRLEAESQALAVERKQVETLRGNIRYMFSSWRFLLKQLMKNALFRAKIRPAPDPTPFLTWNCTPGAAGSRTE
jgi:hypothetical protein